MDSHSCGFLLGSQKVVSKLEIVDFLYLFPFPCFPCPLWQTLRKGKNSLRVNLIEQLQCRLCIQWVLNKAYFPLSSVSESLLQVSVLLLMRSFGKWFLQQVPLKNSCYFKRSSLLKIRGKIHFIGMFGSAKLCPWHWVYTAWIETLLPL